MNRFLLEEMNRQADQQYTGLVNELPRSKRARRDLARARAQFSGQSYGIASATLDARSRGLSRSIWGNFPIANIQEDAGYGSFYFDDFLNFGGTVTSNVGTYGPGYKSREDSSSTIKQLSTLGTLATPAEGVIELATTAATSINTCLEAGYGNAGSMGLTGNVLPMFCWEARVQINLATVAGFDAFIGLGEKGLAVTAGASSIFATADTLNQKSVLGFWSLTAAPTVINAGYGKNGSAATIPTVSTAAAWKAQTWTKLGIVYDPRQPQPVLKFYQDGVMVSSVNDCTVSAFPTGVVLTPYLDIQSDAATSAIVKLDADWHAWGHYYG